MILVIGNKNYSSWSLRPWLALKVLGLPFEEKRIPLYGAGHPAVLSCGQGAGPHRRRHHGVGLARDPRVPRREAPSGFPNLRQHMGMNVGKRYPGKGRKPEVLAEIRRIDEIWSQAKMPFLFGPFSVTARNNAYCEAVLALPAMREWIAAAEREAESLPQFEQYE